MKSKIGIVSLGCPRNLVDSEAVLGRLKAKGYKIVDIQEADIGIVNTCAFIKEAKQESIDVIIDLVRLKREGRLNKVIVTGCLAQRYKQELVRSFREVDVLQGTIDINQNHYPRYFIESNHSVYLKISEGCQNNCSFCVIPKIKGNFYSRSLDSILKELSDLDNRKAVELNIIGQDISLYGKDIYGKPSLAKLIETIIKKVKNIKWIRLLYLNPGHISDDLISLIRNEGVVCKYIDLPLQHINNRILKLMHRKTSKSDIFRLLEKLRRRIPNLVIRTTLLVGFPTETESEFNELLDFIEKERFERLGAFIYSKEEGTPAYNFGGHIPEKIKRERFNTLMAKQQIITSEYSSSFLGKIIDVLIDEKAESDKDIYLGRSQGDAPSVDGLVYVNSIHKLNSGEIIKVKITDTYEYDLVGERFYEFTQ
jgi:ribosomal protein S12 methylthiotransferase